MHNISRQLFASALVAAGALAAGGAQAQYYGTAPQQPPLYPYAAPVAGQPYAVEVAPNTYVIRRPATRSYPYVANGERKAPRFDRPPKKANRALIEELRKRMPAKNGTAATTKIVRNRPIVVEHTRVVDDPPRVVERHIVEDAPAPTTDHAPAVERRKPRAGRTETGKRVIQADAEITILGPDRMSIRLFRKGHGPRAEKEPD